MGVKGLTQMRSISFRGGGGKGGHFIFSGHCTCASYDECYQADWAMQVRKAVMYLKINQDWEKLISLIFGGVSASTASVFQIY